MKELLSALRAAQIELLENEPLCNHSSFRVGGIARVIALPRTREQLLSALRIATQCGVRTGVFGNASNVVFSDAGFDGLLVLTGNCRAVTQTGNVIVADCGASVGRIAKAACDASLSGAEFLHGIPATLGGAVVMNAGAFEGGMEQIVVSSEYFDLERGACGVLLHDAHEFAHRMSAYIKNSKLICLGATMELRAGDPAEIRAKMDDFMARRKRTQPLEYPSAGSVFKRPVGHYAAKLIDECGLKGLTVGGAQVSEKHAGFIVNKGGATAADIWELTKKIQEIVLSRTGVTLECEIRFIH